MSEQAVVDIEPAQLQRRSARTRPEAQLEKAELTAIAGDEMLILAACIGNSVIRGLELKEKKRVRRILFLVASGVTLLIGLGGLVIQVLKT